MFLRTERNAGDFTTFYHYWRLAGDSTEMLESPAGCGRPGNYANRPGPMSHLTIINLGDHKQDIESHMKYFFILTCPIFMSRVGLMA